MIALFVCVALLALFVLVVAIRTVRFKPEREQVYEGKEIAFDKDAAISALQALVRCKTISRQNPGEEDDAEFDKLIALLAKLYPHVWEKCPLKTFDGRGLLFHWKGKSRGEPSVMMSHYDVVPVDEAKWDKPPFSAALEDGVIWGRGTVDTKATLNGVLSAADALIAQGFVPENDIYFAFSGSEEICGDGAKHIVSYFKEKGITPGLVLDEGGAVVEGVFPGVKKPCAMVGIAEKGRADITYSISTNGGHASAPKPHTPVGILSQACVNVENHPFKCHITKPVAEMFDTLGRHSNLLYRIIFANMWCFSPLLKWLAKRSGGEMNALMRTTVAFTQMQGSDASNVIPTSASMVSNIRLNPEDTVQGAVAYIKKQVKNDELTLTVRDGINPSRISGTDCAGWHKVRCAISAVWQGTVITPYLMMQCSDSRHYGEISDRVYRFSAMDLTAQERASVHGNNEKIRTKAVLRAVEFYIQLMLQC